MTQTPTHAPTHADPIDPGPMKAIVERTLALATQALEAPDAVEDAARALRTVQLALRTLIELEKRNAEIAERDAEGEGEYTRLATMRPLHPDDIRELEAKAETLRDRLLARGRRDALRAAGLSQAPPDQPEGRDQNPAHKGKEHT